MRRYLTFILGLVLIGHCFADTPENSALARISHILASTVPVIAKAKKAQNKKDNVQFDFDALSADIDTIKAGIAQKLNGNLIVPRQVRPISGDYVRIEGKKQ